MDEFIQGNIDLMMSLLNIEYHQKSIKYYIYDFNQEKFKRNLTTFDDLKKAI